MESESTPLRTARPAASRSLCRVAQGTLVLAALLGLTGLAARRDDGAASHLRSVASAPTAEAAAAATVSDLVIDCDTPTAIFVCLARFSVAAPNATTVEVSVAYREEDAAPGAAPLWSPRKTIALAGGDASVATSTALFRLSPSARYTARVFVRDASARGGAAAVVAARAAFTPRATGVPGLDSARGFVNVSGAPSWELMYLTASRDGWDGLVAVDSAGTVVWGYETAVACLFEQDASFRVGLMSTRPEYARGAHKNNCLGAHSNFTDFATGQRGTRATRLSLLYPTGELAATTALECFDEPTGYEEFAHELLPDGGAGGANGTGTGALATIRIDVQRLDEPLVVGERPVDAIFRESIVRWDPAEEAVETLVDFSKFLSPDTTRVYRMPSYSIAAECGQDQPALDVALWMHASSAARSADDDVWVASFVGLAAVAAFAADGASMKWIASCSTGLASSPGLRVLAPESADACFGYPHSVVPINRTHVMLIDDGEMRAGSRCAAAPAGDAASDDPRVAFVHCYSRALMLKLDFERGTFGVAWQFAAGGAATSAADRADPGAWPDDALYSVDGGSAVTLPNGNFLITFGNIRPSTGTRDRGVHSRVFEVSRAGDVHSVTHIPQSSISTNTYRTLPKTSIGGETREPPFALGAYAELWG